MHTHTNSDKRKQLKKALHLYLFFAFLLCCAITEALNPLLEKANMFQTGIFVWILGKAQQLTMYFNWIT